MLRACSVINGHVECRAFQHEDGYLQHDGILFRGLQPGSINQLINRIIECASTDIESCRPAPGLTPVNRMSAEFLLDIMGNLISF